MVQKAKVTQTSELESGGFIEIISVSDSSCVSGIRARLNSGVAAGNPVFDHDLSGKMI